MPPVTPPPVIDSARLLAYATVDESIEYTGRVALLVDGKPLGAVPRLAICQALDEDHILLFHCDERWNVLGASIYPSAVVARERAEAEYRGISTKWIEANISADDAEQFLRGEPSAVACSFCGLLPHQVRQLIQGRGAGICDSCVKNLSSVNEAPDGRLEQRGHLDRGRSSCPEHSRQIPRTPKTTA